MTRESRTRVNKEKDERDWRNGIREGASRTYRQWGREKGFNHRETNRREERRTSTRNAKEKEREYEVRKEIRDNRRRQPQEHREVEAHKNDEVNGMEKQGEGRKSRDREHNTTHCGWLDRTLVAGTDGRQAREERDGTPNQEATSRFRCAHLERTLNFDEYRVPQPVPTFEEAMDILREDTFNYVNVEDPVERGARQERVTQHEETQLMARTAIAMVAQAERQAEERSYATQRRVGTPRRGTFSPRVVIGASSRRRLMHRNQQGNRKRTLGRVGQGSTNTEGERTRRTLEEGSETQGEGRNEARQNRGETGEEEGDFHEDPNFVP